MMDLILMLKDAINRDSDRDIKQCYRDLETVGVDRYTADYLITVI